MTPRELQLPSGRTIVVHEVVVHQTARSRANHTDGQPLHPGARTFNVYYGTAVPIDDAEGRRAEARELIELFAPHEPAASATRLRAMLCDSEACATLRGPPAWVYGFERSPDDRTLRLVEDGPPELGVATPRADV